MQTNDIFTDGMHKQNMIDFLIALDICKKDLFTLSVEALNEALSAAYHSRGIPARLFIDPKSFECLKNITYNDKNLK